MVSQEEVEAVQAVWVAALLRVGAEDSAAKQKQAAAEMVDALYAYELGPVLFKPTQASEHPFRLSRRGAIAYFVGQDQAYPEDQGFALRGWTGIAFDNAALSFNGDRALAMGHYRFRSEGGPTVLVEYTFGYIRDGDGNLRINLHHSSLPFERT